MKLHADQNGSLNTVTAYGADYIEINAIRHGHSLFVLPEGAVHPWPVSRFADLSAEHFSSLLQHAPQVVIFGTGDRLRFPHPRLTTALSSQRIGVEAMDLQAACRTYNILMAEGRKVLGAFLLERD